MLKPKSPQASFYGSYLYDRIVPSDHLLRRINAVVDFSFVNDLVKDRYTPDFGRPAEDPEFMLRLCLLQYLYGDSDREVIANAKLNLAYKYFLGLAVDEEPPDDTTVSYFRAIRLGEEKFRQVFQNIVKQCIDKGLVSGKHQIVDSTHIEADIAINSLAGVVRISRRNVIKDLTKQNPGIAKKLGIEKLQINKQDKFARKEKSLENEVEEARTLLDSVTHELKQGTLAATAELARSLEVLEKVVADREEGVKDRLVSPVDPDARAGKKTGKRWVGYKGHLVVEEDSEIITAIETTPGNTDEGTRLMSLITQQEKACSIIPGEISGDKAYDSGANLEQLDAKKITGYISLSKKINHYGADLFTVDNFKYDEAKDTLTCPAGCVATHSKRDLVLTEDQIRKGIYFEFSHRQCSACELKATCFTSNSKIHGRMVHISYYQPYYEQMKQRMESDEGKAVYRNRYKIEHKVADLARYCGMRRCRYRGLDKAKIHTLLAAIASNVKRMARLLWQVADGPPLQPVMAA